MIRMDGKPRNTHRAAPKVEICWNCHRPLVLEDDKCQNCGARPKPE